MNRKKYGVLIIIILMMVVQIGYGQEISLTSFNFANRLEKNIIISNPDLLKRITPHHPSDSIIHLDAFSTHLKYENSDLSPLFRSRDLFGDVKKFPSSAILKLVKLVNDKEVGTCTGTLIGDKYLITAAHCIKTEEDKYPDKIVVLPLYDNGTSGYRKQTASVEKVYYLSGYDKFDNKKESENGNDMAIYKINLNLGEDLGYIGMVADKDPVSEIFTFSYPNKSAVEYLMAAKAAQTDSLVLKDIDRVIKIMEITTPDFDKKNQYFKYGNVYRQEKGKSFILRTPYAIPGESGASWITSDYYLAGINSSLTNGIAVNSANSLLIAAFIQVISSED